MDCPVKHVCVRFYFGLSLCVCIRQKKIDRCPDPRARRQLWGHHCRILGLIEGWLDNIRGEGGEGAQLLLLTIITHNAAAEGRLSEEWAHTPVASHGLQRICVGREYSTRSLTETQARIFFSDLWRKWRWGERSGAISHGCFASPVQLAGLWLANAPRKQKAAVGSHSWGYMEQTVNNGRHSISRMLGWD